MAVRPPPRACFSHGDRSAAPRESVCAPRRSTARGSRRRPRGVVMCWPARLAWRRPRRRARRRPAPRGLRRRGAACASAAGLAVAVGMEDDAGRGGASGGAGACPRTTARCRLRRLLVRGPVIGRRAGRTGARAAFAAPAGRPRWLGGACAGRPGPRLAAGCPDSAPPTPLLLPVRPAPPAAPSPSAAPAPLLLLASPRRAPSSSPAQPLLLLLLLAHFPAARAAPAPWPPWLSGAFSWHPWPPSPWPSSRSPPSPSPRPRPSSAPPSRPWPAFSPGRPCPPQRSPPSWRRGSRRPLPLGPLPAAARRRARVACAPVAGPPFDLPSEERRSCRRGRVVEDHCADAGPAWRRSAAPLALGAHRKTLCLQLRTCDWYSTASRGPRRPAELRDRIRQ